MKFDELLEMKVIGQDKDGNDIELSPEFRIAIQGKKMGGIHIIVHPIGHNGDTLDFIVKGNTFTLLK